MKNPQDVSTSVFDCGGTDYSIKNLSHVLTGAGDLRRPASDAAIAWLPAYS